MTSLIVRIAGFEQCYPTFYAQLCRFFLYSKLYMISKTSTHKSFFSAHTQKESLVGKGFNEATISVLYSCLSILDITSFFSFPNSPKVDVETLSTCRSKLLTSGL